MKRPISSALISVLVLACGATSTTSPAPSSSTPAATAVATPAGDPTVVEARAAGITIKEGDAGTADLQGGKYRIAWHAPGCTMLGLQVASPSGETTSIDVRLPSGKSTLDLPAGQFVINRKGDCDYTVRFEEAP